MKNVNELRIPAYAVVDMGTGRALEVIEDRGVARHVLQEYKRYNKGSKFKIVKLVPQKFVR